MTEQTSTISEVADLATLNRLQEAHNARERDGIAQRANDAARLIAKAALDAINSNVVVTPEMLAEAAALREKADKEAAEATAAADTAAKEAAEAAAAKEAADAATAALLVATAILPPVTDDSVTMSKPKSKKG